MHHHIIVIIISYDVHNFLVNTLSNEALSANAKAQKEELVQKLACLPDIAPPYIDMNGSSKCINQSEEYVDVNTNDDHTESKLYEEFPDQNTLPQEDQQTVVNYENLTISASKIKDVAKKFGPLCRKEKFLFMEHVIHLWCGILGDMFCIYNTDKDAKAANIIHVRGYEARAAPAYCSRDVKKRDCCFELVCPGKKSYQFIARTAKDMEQWIACVNEASSYGLEEADSEMNPRRRQLPSLPRSDDGSEEYDDIHGQQLEETEEKIYHDIRELNVSLETSGMLREYQLSNADETVDGELVYDDICVNNPSSVYYNMAGQTTPGMNESEQRATDADNKMGYNDDEDIYDDIGVLTKTPEAPKQRSTGNDAPNSIHQIVQKMEARSKTGYFSRVLPESVECAKKDNDDIPSDNFYEPIDNPIDDSYK